MPKNPYKLISPQAGRHSKVCDLRLIPNTRSLEVQKQLSNLWQMIWLAVWIYMFSEAIFYFINCGGSLSRQDIEYVNVISLILVSLLLRAGRQLLEPPEQKHTWARLGFEFLILKDEHELHIL